MQPTHTPWSSSHSRGGLQSSSSFNYGRLQIPSTKDAYNYKQPNWLESDFHSMIPLFVFNSASHLSTPLQGGSYPRWLNSAEQQEGQNSMERSLSSARKTIPVLTNLQGDARTKQEGHLATGRAESRMERSVRHRLGWMTQDRGCGQQVTARTHLCCSAKTYRVRLKEPHTAKHQSATHGQASYLLLLHSLPLSLLCLLVFSVQLMALPST